MNSLKKNVLLIGNSKQLENTTFVQKNICFDRICRFNIGFAQIYDKISKYSGNSFDTMILHHYSHDEALNELKKFNLLEHVKYIMMMPPKLSHTNKPVKYAKGIAYEKLNKNDFIKIDKILAFYKFPSSIIPRTGIIAILYLIFFKNVNVYLLGFDIYGTDSPNDQHILPNIKITPCHSIREESKLLIRLIREKKLFLYDDI